MFDEHVHYIFRFVELFCWCKNSLFRVEKLNNRHWIYHYYLDDEIHSFSLPNDFSYFFKKWQCLAQIENPNRKGNLTPWKSCSCSCSYIGYVKGKTAKYFLNILENKKTTIKNNKKMKKKMKKTNKTKNKNKNLKKMKKNFCILLSFMKVFPL